MDTPQDFATAFAALIEDEHRNAGPEPTPAEILAYLDGELSPEDEEELQERFSLHPEATRLLLGLADPSRLAAAEEDATDWASLREKMRDEGLLDPPATATVVAGRAFGATVVPIRPGVYTGVHSAWRWAAVVLLGLSAVLAVRLGFPAAPVPEPRADGTHLELRPLDESGLRDGTGDELSAGAAWHTLVLLGDAGDFDEYRVEILDEDGKTRWAGAARPGASGTFDVLLPSGFLKPGRYEVRLLGVDGERRELVATYRFRRSRPYRPLGGIEGGNH